MTERHSVSQSTVRLFGIDLVVHHLNTGECVIEQDSMLALFEVMGDPGDAPDTDFEALAAIFSGKPA